MPATPKLYLAPMRGFTDYIFRNTFSRHFNGFDGAVAPFITAPKLIRSKSSHLKDVLPENNATMPLVPQILGNNSKSFIPLAERLFDLGYKTVNWNLGCPFPVVAKKQRGSGLLPYPDRIKEFLDKTVATIPNRLSIKVRLGRKATDEIFKLLPIFNQYPLEAVIIHPRTGKQMYAGETDLETFEKCLELARHRIVYNGDITSLDSFTDLSARFKSIDDWMIGRAAVSNPFLPAIIKAGKDEFTKKVDLFNKFYNDLFERYQEAFSGPGHLLDRMKGFWTYFSQSLENGKKIRKKIHRTHKLQRYLDIVKRFFDDEAVWINNNS